MKIKVFSGVMEVKQYTIQDLHVSQMKRKAKVTAKDLTDILHIFRSPLSLSQGNSHRLKTIYHIIYQTKFTFNET